MPDPLVQLFILLVAAHSYGDFLFQTNWIARQKDRLPVLFLHTLIHGALAYLIVQQWTLISLPLLLMVFHFIIDFIKCRLPRSPRAFALDQLAHLVSIALIVGIVDSLGFVGSEPLQVVGYKWIVLGAGLAAVVLGTGYFIAEVAQKMTQDNPQLREDIGHGLKDGGAQIGQLERALIFALIVMQQPMGIGFLVAAKSILRFEEAKKQHLAEYVLIGTLWSFGLAIAISWITLNLVGLR